MTEANGASGSIWDLSGTFDFEGQRIHYGVLGEGSPLVLLHGTPFSSIVWRRIAPYLARHRQVFYFDLLGYGRSEMRQGQDVSLGIQNLVFAALLDHWGLERPDVVAHDFGGTTALRTHLLNGRDYRSLTLIDPVAIGPSGSAFVQAAKDHEETFAGLPAYIHAAILRAYIGGAVHRPLSDDDMDLYLEPWLETEGQSAFYRQTAQMSDRYTDEVESHYGEVRCPVTILWGEEDAWIPYERGQTLAKRIPNASFHLIAGASHLVQEDAPEVIVAAVLDFLPKLNELFNQYSRGSLMKELTAYIRENVMDEEKEIKLKGLYHYLEQNQDYLVNYEQRKQAKQTVSSTVAESHIDTLINARHKKTGKMQWTCKGAHQVLQIRAMMASNQWQGIGTKTVLSALVA